VIAGLAALGALSLLAYVNHAQSAATSPNLQLWSVVAVEDPDRKARLADLAGGGQAHIRQAPVLLVWLADLARAERITRQAGHGRAQPSWILVTPACMLGQVGLPGGGYGLGYGAMNTKGSAHARLSGPVFPQGQNAVSTFIPVARIADMPLGPGESFTYNGVTHAYPDIPTRGPIPWARHRTKRAPVFQATARSALAAVNRLTGVSRPRLSRKVAPS
jgi:hypothetical protein